jgi:hypothetical protein
VRQQTTKESTTMQVGTETNAEARRKPQGRKAKTSDHQEAAITLDKLTAAVIHTLVADLKHAQEAGDIFASGIKAQAEKAGIQASVLRKFIAARAGESFAEKKRDAEQLALLFDEIGE